MVLSPKRNTSILLAKSTMDSFCDVKLELFARQNEIINLQSEALNDAIHLLCQCETAEKCSLDSIIDKINKAARIRTESQL